MPFIIEDANGNAERRRLTPRRALSKFFQRFRIRCLSLVIFRRNGSLRLSLCEVTPQVVPYSKFAGPPRLSKTGLYRPG